MKVIQVSTSWCGHCPPARQYLQTNLEDSEYIYVETDTNILMYAGEDVENISDSVNKALGQFGPIRGVPAFMIVDDEFNIINKPRGPQVTLQTFLNENSTKT